MKFLKLKFTFVVILCLFNPLLFSCNHPVSQEKLDENKLKEHLENANRIIVADETKEIKDFIDRHQFKMTMTGTGLWMGVYQAGSGKAAGLHQLVTLTYKAYLLDGTLCYSADEKKPLQFRLGEGTQVRGLEEGIEGLKEGDHARQSFQLILHME
jgi:FKBP-type peptidyl-prolyl cis-trans isomerase